MSTVTLSDSASSHSSIDKNRTRQMEVDNLTFFLERLFADCSPKQFLRELTQNSIEAILQTQEKTGEIIWDMDELINDLGEGDLYKLCITDTGTGMTGEEMVQYINQLSSSSHEQSMHTNYGVGAKISALPLNKEGICYQSWKDGRGYMVKVHYDKNQKVYGLERFEKDGFSEYWTHPDEALKPSCINKHGTKVTLWGNSYEANTMEPRSTWVTSYLNSRYYKFPKDIKVKVRDGWHLASGDKHNFLREIAGMEPWLNERKKEKGKLQLTNATAHWWILDDGNLDTHGRGLSGGHIAALYKDELYEVRTGKSGVTRLQNFGITFGAKQVVIYVEPNAENTITNVGRSKLQSNHNEDLPWDEWASEFRQNLPPQIQDFVEEIGSAIEGQDSSSILERLKRVKFLFKITRYKRSATGQFLVDPEAGTFGGIPVERQQESKKRSSSESGGKGGRSGDIYSLFQSTPGLNAEEIAGELPHLDTKWITIKNGTRSPEELEDRAATFDKDTKTLRINADFRIIIDMVERWTKKYEDFMPGAKSQIEKVVREWFTQQLHEAIYGSFALKGSKYWTSEHIAQLWTEEALTAVILPRRAIDDDIKRELGRVVGSLNRRI